MMVLMMAAFAGIAQGGGQQRNFDPEEMAKTQTAQIKEKCSLNATQEKQVHELLLTNGKKIQAEREKMMAAGDQPTEETRAKMRKIRDDQNAEMKKILTADQYKNYEKYLEERRAQRGGGGPR